MTAQSGARSVSAPLRRDLVRPAAVLLLLVASAAMVASSLLERGNLPYTRNFATPVDYAVTLALFTVPILGSAILGLRPRHLSGWLMLASGVAFSLGQLCHALAVRLLVVAHEWHVAGLVAAWLAMWLLVPGFSMLPFVVATWPDGRIERKWLRPVAGVAAGASAVVTAAQAVAPDRLDGTAAAVRIANPLGVTALRGAAHAATAAGIAVLAAFALAATADVLVRAARAHGERRRQLAPMAGVIVAVLVVGVLFLLTGGRAVLAGLLVGIPGVGLAIVLATRAVRRAERVEREREALVAEREDERRRVRRELHDGVGPLLAALRLELDDAPDGPATDRARQLLDDAIGEVRRIARDLRPAHLDELGLAGAVRQQANVLSGVSGVRMNVVASDRIPVLPAAVEVALLRIAGEALTNVVRHAGAAHCTVELDVDGVARLRVADDGVGLNPAHEGVGLRSMRARAEELGGTFDIRTAEGGGTVVDATVPIPRDDHA